MAGSSTEGIYNRTGQNNEEDQYYVHSSDHSSLVLVTELLTETNYVPWSRSLMKALETRDKQGFVNGDITEPPSVSPLYKRWKRANALVVSWILNSMTKDIAHGFIFAENARILWEEIAEQYGTCNGPLLYQLKRDLSSLTQGSSSVAGYFFKLKRLWDELGVLRPVHKCNCCRCGFYESFRELEQEDRLVQFLMGLNDIYGAVSNQIMLMDPLPSVSKALAMVTKVERQRDVQHSYTDIGDTSAMLARTNDSKRSVNRIGAKNKKSELKCSFCNATGHTKESCFKIIEFPDWWKGKKDTGSIGSRNKHFSTANAVNMDLEASVLHGSNDEALQNVVADLVQKEIGRMLKGKEIGFNTILWFILLFLFLFIRVALFLPVLVSSSISTCI